MSTWYERKAERIAYFFKYVYGWKLKECGACAGSGYYDAGNNPACGCCDGTGRTRYKSVIVSKPTVSSVLPCNEPESPVV